MSAPIVVLKLGGSVLTDEQALPGAVHEIYRHVRRGRRVLAVVSALKGTTDALLERGRALGGEHAPHGLAPLLATGEAQATALLVLALERAGVPARAMEPHAVGLRAEGPPLDATPYTLDADAFRRAFELTPALVLPGFVARDVEGSRVLLGRGGTDLTALFCASALDAKRCVLVKDVDGLYDRDPAATGSPAPRRYARLSWERALELSGVILQEKAARFALAHHRTFEVGAFGRTDTTHVGEGPDRFAEPVAPPRPLRVGLLGLGTVGGGVAAHLARATDRLTCVGAVVRDPSRARAGAPPLLPDVDALLALEPDVVVEALGGIEPAYGAITRALEAGVDVVSANKALLAEHGAELALLAARSGARLCDSAAVGGAVPCLEIVRAHATDGLTHIEGVLNATSTAYLDRLVAGDTPADAVLHAQAAGLAEADPARDLDGTDAAQKLMLLARAAWGDDVGLRWHGLEGVEGLDPAWVRAEIERGRVVRLVARAQLDAGGARLLVRPESLSREADLAATCGTLCALRVLTRSGQLVTTHGRGAGRWPTAEAVMADLLELSRRAARTAQDARAASPA